MSDMTTEELTEWCNKKDKDFLVRLCYMLVATIQNIGKDESKRNRQN